MIEEQKEEESKVVEFDDNEPKEMCPPQPYGMHSSLNLNQLKVENMLSNDSRLVKEIILSKLTLIVHKKSLQSIR